MCPQRKKLVARHGASVAQSGQEAERRESWEVLNHARGISFLQQVLTECLVDARHWGDRVRKMVLLHSEPTFPRGVLPAQWEHQQVGVEGASPGMRKDQTCAWGLGDATVEAGRCSRWRPLQALES